MVLIGANFGCADLSRRSLTLHCTRRAIASSIKYGRRLTLSSVIAQRCFSGVFKDRLILPTGEQGRSCIRCQYLTNFYRSIELVRFDQRTGIGYIFVTEALQVVIYSNGNWRFR